MMAERTKSFLIQLVDTAWWGSVLVPTGPCRPLRFSMPNS